MITVVVSGAAGKMGQESCRAVLKAQDMKLVGVVDPTGAGTELSKIIGLETDLVIQGDLATALQQLKPDVVVDFTNPEVVFANAKTCLENGVRPVIGTTGMSGEQIQALKELAAKEHMGGLLAPNFAIGALLMMKFATMPLNSFLTRKLLNCTTIKRWMPLPELPLKRLS